MLNIIGYLTNYIDFHFEWNSCLKKCDLLEDYKCTEHLYLYVWPHSMLRVLLYILALILS